MEERAKRREDKRREDEAAKKKAETAESSASSGPEVGTRFSAAEIHENIVEEAEEELDRPAFELALSGLASGLLVGFSFLSVALISQHMPPADHAIAAALGYPLGFIFVVLARHQLFTENTLEPVLPVLEQRTARALRSMLRLWAIVLLANLVGAALFALVVARTPMLEPTMSSALLATARDAVKDPAALTLYKAIWAGWLVALMAWLIASTRDTTAQVILIWAATAPIAGLGFKHSIAGATEAFYLVWLGDIPFGTMLTRFEIPALVGNIIGGVVLVALLNYGQVRHTKDH